MKTRTHFVANSSSSSFIINKADLTEKQIEYIKNYYVIAKEYFDNRNAFIAKYGCPEAIEECNSYPHDYQYFGYLDNEWDIEETESTIEGKTIMDNFDFDAFLKFIGVDKAKFMEY